MSPSIGQDTIDYASQSSPPTLAQELAFSADLYSFVPVATKAARLGCLCLGVAVGPGGNRPLSTWSTAALSQSCRFGRPGRGVAGGRRGLVEGAVGGWQSKIWDATQRVMATKTGPWAPTTGQPSCPGEPHPH
jgi:hypothetical protein